VIDAADRLGFIPPRELADSAEDEALIRERKLVLLVNAGGEPPEAQMEDWHAWLMIADWLARGPQRLPRRYAAMDAAAERAVAHLGALCRQRPDDSAMADRMAIAERIRRGVKRSRALYDDLNAALRNSTAVAGVTAAA
jgi:hypothetical protein